MLTGDTVTCISCQWMSSVFVVFEHHSAIWVCVLHIYLVIYALTSGLSYGVFDFPTVDLETTTYDVHKSTFYCKLT